VDQKNAQAQSKNQYQIGSISKKLDLNTQYLDLFSTLLDKHGK